MNDFPDRLEPFKTLHETRANDQYGKLRVFDLESWLTQILVEALVFEIPAKLASRTMG